VGSRFEGIPIVDEYKYLGLVLDNRLSGDNHMNKLSDNKKHRGKIVFIKNNLNPLIRNISLDYRVNLWQTLIRPLFVPIALLGNFLCESSRLGLERKLKKSLKWFMGLTKTVPDVVLYSLINVDFKQWAIAEEEKARKKWESRLFKKDKEAVNNYEIKCAVKFLPKEVANFINLQSRFVQCAGSY